MTALKLFSNPRRKMLGVIVLTVAFGLFSVILIGSVLRDQLQEVRLLKGRLGPREQSEQWKQEQVALRMKQEELSQWVEQVGQEVRSFKEERDTLLNRMRTLLKERNEAIQQANAIKEEWSAVENTLAQRTEKLEGLQAQIQTREKVQQQLQDSTARLQEAEKRVGSLDAQLDGLQREAAQNEAFLWKGAMSLLDKFIKANSQRQNAFQVKEKGELELESLRSKLIQDAVKLYIRTGSLEAAQGHLQKSEEAFLKAIQLDPKSASAYYNLGVLYEDYFRDRAKAIKAYEQYLLLSPQAPDAPVVQEWLARLKSKIDPPASGSKEDWGRPGFHNFSKALKQVFQ